MAGKHHTFIPEVLYRYNADNALNEKKVNQQNQWRIADRIVGQRAYQPLDEKEVAVIFNSA